MMNDPFQDQLIEYCLNQLSEEARRSVKAHLDSGCASCKAELETLQETFNLLPSALSFRKVSPDIKLRIDAAIAEESLKENQFSELQTFSHYRLLRRLGLGGMGEVFLAEDTRLGRTTAIKMIRPELATNVERKKRFLREARAAAVLSHPGIATIYEIGEESGTDFIAMEYVEGRPLSEIIQAHPLEPVRMIALAVQLAGALSEAHERGILHRDLKPENIQVRNNDQVKILDFGLAKFMETRLEDDYTTTSDRILGTIPYMSPEQLEGKQLDPRSDLFSLGSVLYEMASGTSPFLGDNPGMTLDNILEKEPLPLAQRNPKLPESLQRIVHLCLQKDPARRYQTAKQLERDLVALQKGEPVNFNQTMVLQAAPSISIAVLYFENLSEEKESDYFRAGMTEDIITELAKVKSWVVRPRTQVVRYKDQQIDLVEVGEDLNVTHVLQGSIRKAGNRLRISAQLVDTRNAASVWAERYDRDIKDIFDIQSEIAHQIATALEVHLTKTEKSEIEKRRTANLEAYDSYLRGREMIFLLSKEGIHAAIEHFTQAVRADANYSLAYAGLAQAQAIGLSFFGGKEDIADLAIENAKKAIELESNSEQAYTALALAYMLKRMSHEAVEACARAIELNPNDPFATWVFGRLQYRLNQYEKAAQYFKRTIELLPEFYTAYTDLSQAYENLDMKEMAEETRRKTVDACRRYLEQNPQEARAHIFLATSYARLGAIDQALAEGRIAESLGPEDPVLMYNLACLYSLVNAPETATSWLARSMQFGRRDLEWLQRDPALQNVRNHPSFQSLLKQFKTE